MFFVIFVIKSDLVVSFIRQDIISLRELSFNIHLAYFAVNLSFLLNSK